MITAADQDYIKAIYRLQEEHGQASTSALAKALRVTPASVSGMLRKLSGSQLVSHRHHKGVQLTESGRKAALDVLRRHRLIELFLVEILGMPWEGVHEEAERLEHTVSDKVLARIDRLLGYPKNDPHGAPIPSQKGKLTTVCRMRLDELAAGQKGIVREVSDGDPAMLRHLSGIGLIPGATVTVREILPVDGTRVLLCGKKRQMVSPTVASAVWVSRR